MVDGVLGEQHVHPDISLTRVDELYGLFQNRDIAVERDESSLS
jgi:hypothetical protein